MAYGEVMPQPMFGDGEVKERRRVSAREKMKSDEYAKSLESIGQSIRYMHGIWPEMVQGLDLQMKRDGKGIFQRRKAKQLLLANADRVFHEAAARFQQLSEEKRNEVPDGMGVTERERIAFRLFESLLAVNGFLLKKGMLAPGLSESHKQALRGEVSPEEYASLEEKLREEQEQIAFLRHDEPLE